MNYPLILLLLALAGLAYWYFVRRSPRTLESTVEDRVDTVIGWQPRVTRVMTDTEQQAYNILRAALPDYMVLSQVPLSRFIKVSTRNSYVEWLRRVGNQCADLVVCDGASKVVAAIEVRNTAAQISPRAAKRSARKTKSLKAAGVAFHIWPDNALPSVAQVRQLLWSSSENTTELSGLAPNALIQPEPPQTVRRSSNDAVVVDDGSDFNDAPPSTWFDDLDSAPVPLTPGELARRATAPS